MLPPDTEILLSAQLGICKKLITWIIEHTLRLLEAFFVIRRKSVPYGADSPYLGIEQSLMGVIKGRTGLKRGKEFTEVNYIIWCKNRPIIAKVLACMRSMTNYRPKMGQMSVRALGDTRSKKDADNVSTIKSFFVERLMLQDGIKAQLKSIATGLIAPSKCNVHEAVTVGNLLPSNLCGQNPMTVVIKKVDLCIQMPARSDLPSATGGSKKVLDLYLLFQRAMSCVASMGFSTTMEEVFRYELSSYPLSTFEESGMMRSTKKSELAGIFIEKNGLNTKTDGIVLDADHVVIDGGALLHRVPWGGSTKDLITVSEIVKCYRGTVFSNHRSPSAVTVVFDSYEAGQQSTKQQCHTKRNPIVGLQLSITSNTPMVTKKGPFYRTQPINRLLSISLQRISGWLVQQ